MSSVGSAIRDDSWYGHSRSILEFGSATGESYRILQPEIYCGVDRDPQWQPMPPTPLLRVEKCDVRDWVQNSKKYNLVICDAHGAVDDPEIRAVTEAQIGHAMKHVLSPGLIVVDDCWHVEIGRAALKLLEQPNHICVERPGLWAWGQGR